MMRAIYAAVAVLALAASPAFANFEGPPSGPTMTPVPVSQGGTGQTSAPAAISAMGAASAGTNADITSLTALTTPISVSQGGTNATTAPAALASLGAAASGANGDITSISGITTPILLSEGGTGSGNAPGARANIGAAASGVNGDITSFTGLTTPLPVSEGGIGVATATQATVFAAPSGGSGAPAFRALVNSDLPIYIAPGSTVAALPSCSVSIQGQIRYVTNALLPTLLSVVTGGGTTVVMTFCNGASWVVL